MELFLDSYYDVITTSLICNYHVLPQKSQSAPHYIKYTLKVVRLQRLVT